MGKILITGVNGYLGGIITKEILENSDYDVLAVASSKEKVEDMLTRMQITEKERVTFMSNADCINMDIPLEDIDGAVHLAFARRVRPAADIASSLNYAESVFKKLAKYEVDRVINMSSQGIYGSTEEFRTEQTPAAPATHYTMAKYASEILFNNIMEKTPKHTCFRLDLVAQSQNIVKALCNQAKEGKISLKGGKQIFSFIDGEDVGRAVLAMLSAEGTWDRTYNVGWNRRRYNLVEVADTIADAAVKCGFERPEITLDEQDISLWAGMDSSRFMEKTGWKPQLSLGDTAYNILRAED